MINVSMMKRLYYFLLLAGGLLVTSCEKEEMAMAPNGNGLFGASDAGYVSRLLTPPGFERGVGYSYATGAQYLEGVAFNIFNLNYLDSIQYVKGLNFISDDYTPYSEEQVITGETRSAVSNQLAISAGIGVNAIVADIQVQGNYSKGSVEESQSVFAMKRTKRVAYCRDLQYKNVVMYYKETGDSLVFAPGFFADWKKLEGNNTDQANVSNKMVLDFVNKWGRGFVARSFMGGVLEYTLQIDKSSLSENMSVGMAINASVGLLIGVETSSSTQSSEFSKVSRDRYSLDIHARGGDVQAITAILSGQTPSPQGIQNWMASVNFPPSPDSEQLKLCSMTDIKIASIAYLFTGRVQEKVNYILRNNAQ